MVEDPSQNGESRRSDYPAGFRLGCYVEWLS